jgi:hypothetical protein
MKEVTLTIVVDIITFVCLFVIAEFLFCMWSTRDNAFISAFIVLLIEYRHRLSEMIDLENRAQEEE